LLNDLVEQLLRSGLQVESHILVRLVARHRRDALHEIEDALCRAQDYAERRLFRTWIPRRLAGLLYIIPACRWIRVVG
jgi:hypothetical protein